MYDAVGPPSGPVSISKSRFFLRAPFAFAAFFALFTSVAIAAPLTIANGDFFDAGNFGSVGGGLLGASGVDVPIGAGPWTGSYAGVLGLLAPPTLTISTGQANIDGLAAANVLGILNNGGYFSQTLATNYQPQTRYTLAVEVDSGTTLDASLLAGGNFGIALRSGTTTLASSATSPPQLVSLTGLGGTSYLLTMLFDTNDTISGAVDVQLFAQPQGLTGISLLPSVAFAAVSLDATALNPVSGLIVAMGGAAQTTTVATPFAQALQVRVTDLNGDPVPNVTVTFAAPANGASAGLSAFSATTNNNGLAEVDATANTVAGAYAVSASVEGVDAPAIFSLTNTAGAASDTIAASGVVQSAPVNTPFPVPLVVFVTDEFGNPVSGTDVAFAAPASGPSAGLSAGIVVTDANGLAQVTAIANGLVGSYSVAASVDGIVPAAVFELSNRVDLGTTITGGSGNGQSANINGAFLCALSVTVNDANGNPQIGFGVDFVAPSTGASAMLFDGIISGTSLRILTDANGKAIVTATANDIPGDYVIIAQLVNSSAPAVDFSLSNITGLIFRNGFDSPCAPPFAQSP
jgi:hypothetical protein